jgi:two-component system LytT family response regulator
MGGSVAERRALRVLVVDDEPLGRGRLLDLLEEQSDVEVVGTAADGAAAVDAIRTLDPDLVFLDVQMPRMSGVDVVREIGTERMPATIFVTAYDEYALQAFDAAAVDYLVKPFRDERFEEAFRRARRRIEADSREQLHEQLMALLRGEPSGEPSRGSTPRHLERIAVQMKGRMRVVPVGSIDYITASGAYAELHVGTERFVIRESMQQLEERLDPARFMRVHRSTIVRLDLVETLLRSEGSDYHVQLKGGTRLRVSRSRREALEQRLGKV